MAASFNINPHLPPKTPSGASPRIGQQKIDYEGRGSLKLECIAEHHVGNPARSGAEGGEEVICIKKFQLRPRQPLAVN